MSPRIDIHAAKQIARANRKRVQRLLDQIDRAILARTESNHIAARASLEEIERATR